MSADAYLPPLEQIDEMDHWEGSQLNKAKEILAYELTSLVHGEEEAEKAQKAAKSCLPEGSAANMPEAKLSQEDLEEDAIDLISLLQKSGSYPPVPKDAGPSSRAAYR